VKPVRDVGRGQFTHTLTAVDGSVVKTLKSIAEATFMGEKNGDSHSAWRHYTRFKVDRHVPTRMAVSPGSNSGHNDEKKRLRSALQADHCYIMDRWFAQYTLWNDIVAAGSSYVCRIRENSNLDAAIEERPVSETAAAAGVLRDRLGEPGGVARAYQQTERRNVTPAAWHSSLRGSMLPSDRTPSHCNGREVHQHMPFQKG